MLFVCALLTLSLIDIDHQVLPNLLVLPLLWTGLLFNSLSLFVDLHLAVFGAVAGYLVLWLSCQAHHILTGRAGMGHGDFKLFASIGAWLGIQMLPVVLALACIILLVIFGVPQVFLWSGYAGSCMFRPVSVIGCVCDDTDVAVAVSFAPSNLTHSDIAESLPSETLMNTLGGQHQLIRPPLSHACMREGPFVVPLLIG